MDLFQRRQTAALPLSRTRCSARPLSPSGRYIVFEEANTESNPKSRRPKREALRSTAQRRQAAPLLRGDYPPLERKLKVDRGGRAARAPGRLGRLRGPEVARRTQSRSKNTTRDPRLKACCISPPYRARWGPTLPTWKDDDAEMSWSGMARDCMPSAAVHCAETKKKRRNVNYLRQVFLENFRRHTRTGSWCCSVFRVSRVHTAAQNRALLSLAGAVQYHGRTTLSGRAA